MFHIMRNSTEYGSLDLIDRFADAVRAMAPQGVSSSVRFESASSSARYDRVVVWTVAGASVRFVVEARTRAALVEADRLPVVASGSVPVLVAPFIPSRLRSLLESAGWSYWDPTGNALIRVDDPLVVIRAEGAAKDPAPDPKPVARLRSLKGQTASEVMVALLQYQATGGVSSVRELARQSRLPVSSISRVVSLLREENYLKPTAGGPILLDDPIAAAQRWAQDYSFAKTFRARRCFSLAGPDLALRRIVESDLDYALTGVRAAQEWLDQSGRIAGLPGSELWVYVSDLAKAERIADLAPDSRDGQIVIAECDFLGREQGRRVDGVRYVTPWRAAGDLLSAPGRLAGVGQELAEDLASGFRVPR